MLSDIEIFEESQMATLSMGREKSVLNLSQQVTVYTPANR